MQLRAWKTVTRFPCWVVVRVKCSLLLLPHSHPALYQLFFAFFPNAIVKILLVL